MENTILTHRGDICKQSPDKACSELPLFGVRQYSVFLQNQINQ